MNNITNWLLELATAKKEVGLITANEFAMQETAFNTLRAGYRNMSTTAFKEAMSASSFKTYMTDALSRRFYDQYSVLSHMYTDYTTPDTSPDLREVSRYTRKMNHGMQKRRATGNNRQTGHTVDVVRLRASEFSESFEIPWEVILNDDLSELHKVPNEMASEAATFDGRFVSSLYHNATSQAALIALGAQYAGSAALSEASLIAGITALTTRSKANGDIIETGAITLVTGKGLAYTARKLLANIMSYGNAGNAGVNSSNVLQEFISKHVINPNIVSVGGLEPWYLFADKNVITTVPVLRLQGVSVPFVFTQESGVRMLSGTAPAALLLGGYDNGMISYTVESIIGGRNDATLGGIVDVNGIYYSSGG